MPDSPQKNSASKKPIGVVKRGQAFQMGLHMAACARHRRKLISFQTEALGFPLNRGDVVEVIHPYYTRLLTGNLVSWDAGRLSFEIDAEAVLDNSGNVYLGLSAPDASPWVCRIAKIEGKNVYLDAAFFAGLAAQGAARENLYSNPFDWLPRIHYNSRPAVWWMGPQNGEKTKIVIDEVRHVEKFRFEIKGFNASSEIDDYGHLEPKAWGHKDGPPLNTDLKAPKNITVKVEGGAQEPSLLLSWAPVIGADSYKIEISSDGLSWNLVREVMINGAFLSVAPGRYFIRISASSGIAASPFGFAEADTSIKQFGAPQVLSYFGGVLRLQWQPPDLPNSRWFPYHYRFYKAATLERIFTHTFSVYGGKTQPLEAVISPEMMRPHEGPWRKFYLDINSDINSPPGALVSAINPPPYLNGDIETSAAASSILFKDASVYGETTGFIIARGDHSGFNVAAVREMRVVDSLPFNWEGLTPDSQCYFRLAPKDAFYDATGRIDDLFFSDVLSIKTLES